jgi:outer membrane lipoprotein-sorting protein
MSTWKVLECREVKPGVWLPLRGELSRAPYFPKATLTVSMDLEAVKFGTDLEPACFELDPPAGTKCYDYR